MLPISPGERRSLRARAHSLHPVVSIAQNGLSIAVLKEIDLSLNAHELIKIRVYNDAREERENFLETICSELNAAPIQHIGKLLIVWRPNIDNEGTESAKKPLPRRSRPITQRTKRSFQK